MRLLSVKIDLGDLRRAFGRPRRRVGCGDLTGVVLADVHGRLARGLALVFEGCARSMSGKGDVLVVDVHVEATRVRLSITASLTTGFVEAVRPLICPLGGDLSVDEPGEVRLWLPRA